MADAPDPEQQNQELQRAGIGGAAAAGAVAAHLHRAEQQKQAVDVQDQQLAEQTASRVIENRHAHSKDPVRQPGLGHTVSSRHAQYGSHGFSGQGPK